MADTVFQIQEVHIDRTQNAEVGRSDWYEPMDDTIGALYRNWRAEYGRCTGKVYQDSKDGTTYHVGYVFQARVPYGADSMRSNRVHLTAASKKGRDPGHLNQGTYLCEMWCSWRTLKRDPNAAAPGWAHIPLAKQYEAA